MPTGVLQPTFPPRGALGRRPCRPAAPSSRGPIPATTFRSPDPQPGEELNHPRPRILKPTFVEPPSPTETVSARELQGAVLLVLALYASVAILNLGSELTTIAQSWQAFVEFLASLIF